MARAIITVGVIVAIVLIPAAVIITNGVAHRLHPEGLHALGYGGYLLETEGPVCFLDELVEHVFAYLSDDAEGILGAHDRFTKDADADFRFV